MNDNSNNNDLANRFDMGVSFPIDVFNKSRDEINAEQKEKDRQCLLKIAHALHEGEISEAYAEALVDYYCNGMAACKAVYDIVHQTFGEEDYIKIVDPVTHESLLEYAKMRHVTPNNCSVFRYRDKLDNPANPIYVTFPGLKSVERAIAKYHKYVKEYNEDKAKLRQKYPNDKAYQKQLSSLLLPEQRIRDISRFSFSVKYYKDILNWSEYFCRQKGLHINKKRTKNKFCNNDINNAANFTDNNFRNLVFYIDIPSSAVPVPSDTEQLLLTENLFRNKSEYPRNIKIEVQGKITALDEVDCLTHHLYEKQRVLKEKSRLSSNVEEKDHLYFEYANLNFMIKAIYRMGIEKHNQNEVLDKVARMEENHRIEGDAPNLQGLYPDCVKFIEDNFLARPKQAYVEGDVLLDIPKDIKRQYHSYLENPQTQEVSDDMKQIFMSYQKSPHLKKLFADASPDIVDVAERYRDYIKPKYVALLEKNGQENVAYFESYSQEDNQNIELSGNDEEYKVLSEMSRKHWIPIAQSPNKDVANYSKKTDNKQMQIFNKIMAQKFSTR